MYMYYKDGKKIHLSLLPLFVIRTRKEGRRKNLEIRMFTSFAAKWISTRGGGDGGGGTDGGGDGTDGGGSDGGGALNRSCILLGSLLSSVDKV